MTDRIHSCKHSPTGRHAWVKVTAPIWLEFVAKETCEYCGRDRSVSVTPDVEGFWQDLGRPSEDDHDLIRLGSDFA